MHDLKKVEEKFHEYLKLVLNQEDLRINEIEITEDLLKQEEALYIPFGWISYFLAIEDEKPVVYANACSRMDLDEIIFIDENGFECHDVWFGDNEDVMKRYKSQARKVKRFNYDNLKFIFDMKR